MKKQEREYLSKLVNFGCCICKWYLGVNSPASVHHIRSGMGVGMRNSHYNVLPLCPNHHQHGGHGVAFHAGKKEFEKNFDTEENLKRRLDNELGID